MTANHNANIIEAILFVAGDPVPLADIALALSLTEADTEAIIETIQQQWQEEKRGIVLARYGNSFRLETCPDYAPYIEKLLQPVQKQSLSQTAMETLAVIAYSQPTTKAEVEQIRGVKCDYSIQSLVQKSLIEEVGRKEALGRPILYGTTEQFLVHFGIENVSQLPPLPNVSQEDAPPLTP